MKTKFTKPCVLHTDAAEPIASIVSFMLLCYSSLLQSVQSLTRSEFNDLNGLNILNVLNARKGVKKCQTYPA